MEVAALARQIEPKGCPMPRLLWLLGIVAWCLCQNLNKALIYRPDIDIIITRQIICCKGKFDNATTPAIMSN